MKRWCLIRRASSTGDRRPPRARSSRPTVAPPGAGLSRRQRRGWRRRDGSTGARSPSGTPASPRDGPSRQDAIAGVARHVAALALAYAAVAADSSNRDRAHAHGQKQERADHAEAQGSVEAAGHARRDGDRETVRPGRGGHDVASENRQRQGHAARPPARARARGAGERGRRRGCAARGGGRGRRRGEEDDVGGAASCHGGAQPGVLLAHGQRADVRVGRRSLRPLRAVQVRCRSEHRRLHILDRASVRQIRRLVSPRFIFRSTSSYYFSLFLDQVLAYLLMSASSAAASRNDLWMSSFGKDPFNKKINSAVWFSFIAFIGLATNSLISTTNLFSMI